MRVSCPDDEKSMAVTIEDLGHIFYVRDLYILLFVNLLSIQLLPNSLFPKRSSRLQNGNTFIRRISRILLRNPSLHSRPLRNSVNPLLQMWKWFYILLRETRKRISLNPRPSSDISN